ncbi:hypothetical protein N0K08_08550 [Acidovorax sp. Be4]|uniref:Uncharacterized protein n=1 Tax=Acidovorax bellezanensis TaxID=2976702 RepID=A0ABT2PJM0_9BURK|nr:hypothetical protein [Acidovorax sp. Be4]MCT9810681.1 hypothetical protein [Acidovorax sp. Be4]
MPALGVWMNGERVGCWAPSMDTPRTSPSSSSPEAFKETRAQAHKFRQGTDT